MSKEALFEQINNKAKEEAEMIIQAAVTSARNQKIAVEEQLKAEYDKKIAAFKQEAELNVGGQKTLLRLDEQKLELKAKRSLINEVYQKVVERLNSLSDEEYRSFMGAAILKYAEKGDKVILAKEEKRLDEKWLKSLSDKLGFLLCFDEERHSDMGGVILRGSKYDKNLTVSAMVEEVRKATEGIVSDRLFG